MAPVRSQCPGCTKSRTLKRAKPSPAPPSQSTVRSYLAPFVSPSDSRVVRTHPSAFTRLSSRNSNKRFPASVHALGVLFLLLIASCGGCAAQDETSAELRFLEWLHDLGGREVLPQRTKLRISRAQGGERGMAAAADIAAGEEVVSLPFKAAIVAEEGDPEPFEDCGIHMVLMSKLLREVKRGNESFWAPFTAILPPYIPLPWLPLPQHRYSGSNTTDSSSTEAAVAFAAAGIQELQLPSSVARGAALEAYMRDAYERSDKGVMGGASYGDFLWAFAMYLTRHFSLQLPPSDPRGTISMFLPFGDMANHRFAHEWDDGDVDWAEGIHSDRAIMVALRPVKRGQPVFETYWNGPNEAFCVFQAFLPEPNPHDTVTLFESMRHAVSWLLGFLRGEGRLPESVLAGYGGAAGAAAPGAPDAAGAGSDTAAPSPRAFEGDMLRVAVAAAARIEGSYEQQNSGSSSSSNADSTESTDNPHHPSSSSSSTHHVSQDPQDDSDGRQWAPTAPLPPLPLGFSLPKDGRDSTAIFDAPEAVTVGRRWRSSRRVLLAFAAVIRQVKGLVAVGGTGEREAGGGGGGVRSEGGEVPAGEESQQQQQQRRQRQHGSAWQCTAAEEASVGSQAAPVYLAQVALVARCREMLLALPTTLQQDLALLADVTGNIADVTGQLDAVLGGAAAGGGGDKGRQGDCKGSEEGAQGEDGRVCKWRDDADASAANGDSHSTSSGSSQSGLPPAAYELALRFRVGQKRMLHELVQEWEGDWR